MSSASGMPSANLLSGLPDDLLVNMISFCGPRSCIHLRATSATFAAVTSSQSLWQHFCCREGIVDVEDRSTSDYVQLYRAASRCTHARGERLFFWNSLTSLGSDQSHEGIERWLAMSPGDAPRACGGCSCAKCGRHFQVIVRTVPSVSYLPDPRREHHGLYSHTSYM
jgi:hypothetical protein